jgi:hypothetical protein
MPKIGCREIHFAKATNPYQIDFLIEKVKQAVQQMQLPADYDVKIYKTYSHAAASEAGAS